jgi:hypothetical protein
MPEIDKLTHEFNAQLGDQLRAMYALSLPYEDREGIMSWLILACVILGVQSALLWRLGRCVDNI